MIDIVVNERTDAKGVFSECNMGDCVLVYKNTGAPDKRFLLIKGFNDKWVDLSTGIGHSESHLIDEEYSVKKVKSLRIEVNLK